MCLGQQLNALHVTECEIFSGRLSRIYCTTRISRFGEGGIRTLGSLRYTRFPTVLLRPLRHLSDSIKQSIRGYLHLLNHSNDLSTNKSIHEDSYSKKKPSLIGERGIRTLGGEIPLNDFRDRPIQPLWHLSIHYFFAK